ncbi:MAG: hypothetical protein U0794_16710 [Isosphaeraceae bacterium]
MIAVSLSMSEISAILAVVLPSSRTAVSTCLSGFLVARLAEPGQGRRV